jgi:type IV pilus biogenesis protein CpaD/CtpE
MLRSRSILILAAVAALAACATDGVPGPAQTLAQAADPCQAGPQLTELSDPRAARYFGCANANNLRLMVADPRDLEQGAGMADPSGDPALQAVRRHRLGETKPLPASTSGGMSSGAASESK